MLIKLTTIMCALALGTAYIDGVEPLSEVPMDVATAECGFAAPVPQDPWGHQCDLSKSCKICFYSANNCNSCDSAKFFRLCGTPYAQLCDDSQHSVLCGRVKVHQEATSQAECSTCIGNGSGTKMCNKNSCDDEVHDS